MKFYDVALIDICLSDLNGLELLDKLEDHGCRMIKIVITGSPTMIPKKVGTANAYLLKPVKPEALLAIIEKETREN